MTSLKQLLLIVLMLTDVDGLCLIEMRSWGFDDPQMIGYLRVNGELVVDDTSSIVDKQGFDMYLIRPDRCESYDQRTFDRHLSFDPSLELVNYISILKNGTIICGLTFGDAAFSLSDSARFALMTIGVNASQLDLRGKLMFVATVGQPQLTQYKAAGPSGDNLLMNATFDTAIGPQEQAGPAGSQVSPGQRGKDAIYANVKTQDQCGWECYATTMMLYVVVVLYIVCIIALIQPVWLRCRRRQLALKLYAKLSDVAKNRFKLHLVEVPRKIGYNQSTRSDQVETQYSVDMFEKKEFSSPSGMFSISSEKFQSDQNDTTQDGQLVVVGEYGYY